LKRDIKSLFKVSILTRREPKTKVDLLVTIVVDYLFRIEIVIDISNITKYLFITNLLTITSNFLKLVIQIFFHYRFFNIKEAFPDLK
jgi:hypothetical protein